MRRFASAALSTAVSVTLLSAVWAAVPAQAATSAATPGYTGTVFLNSTGTVDGNGFVTLSGTYRCSVPVPAPAPSPFGPRMVRLHSSVWGPGRAEVAVCDGVEHTWVHRDRPERVPLVTVEKIQSGAELELWESTGWPVITITRLSADRKIVDLQAATS
ncbi:DUF6299 family protein [Kitasatospora sp. NPDC058032]|uniref:DUF6299 family protein n=1 Tax=Kitasatospora sp. NPDC058032 TaxID=3346307 RepID=UPI0036D95010